MRKKIQAIHFSKEVEWESVKRLTVHSAKLACLVITGATQGGGLKVASFLAKLASFDASLNTDSNGIMLTFDIHMQNLMSC